MPNQVIADQQGLRLSDVTKNVSGVQNNWGYGQIYEGFAIRGFETNTTLRDGLRAGGEANGRTSVDMANVEDVEVLKGPAAMLYGRLEPGGLINVVTKQPQPAPQFSVQQQLGSFTLARTTADATGPLTSDGTLLYRVVGEYFRSDSFFTPAPVGKTQLVAPSLLWKPNAKLQASLNVEYRNYDPLTANGVPAIGTRPADIPVTTWVGDTTDWVNVKKTIVNASASYVIDPNWRLRATAIANSQTYDAGLLSAATADDSGNVGNAPWFIHSPSNGRNVAVDLTGHVQTGDIGHTILVGTDYYDLSFSYIGYVAGFSVVDTINVFNPVYNRPTGAGSFRYLHQRAARLAHERDAGVEQPLRAGSDQALGSVPVARRWPVRLGPHDGRGRVARVRAAGHDHQRSESGDGARYEVQPPAGSRVHAGDMAVVLWQLRSIAWRVGNGGEHRRRHPRPAAPAGGSCVVPRAA